MTSKGKYKNKKGRLWIDEMYDGHDRCKIDVGWISIIRVYLLLASAKVYYAGHPLVYTVHRDRTQSEVLGYVRLVQRYLVLKGM